MRRYGSPLRGEVLNIQRRCHLYTGAANTRVYTVVCYWIAQNQKTVVLQFSCLVKIVLIENQYVEKFELNMIDV